MSLIYLRVPTKAGYSAQITCVLGEDATSVKGSSNLSILHNVAFEGQPYNDTRQFGDNILMVGQGSYNNSIIETDDQSVQYSFDVYNPWSNEITEP